MLPSTRARSESSTPESINERIRRETEESIRQTLAGGTMVIDARLRELDREWDTERTLEILAASFTLGGLLLGSTLDRRFLLFSGVVAGFLLQHALQGWCPPLPLIRAAGVRTMAEIEAERYALKVARGDFMRVTGEDSEPIPGRLLLAATRH